MAYRFKLTEGVNRGFQRIGLEQIQRAEQQLLGAASQGTAIHETRKCIKRIRALLRLARPGLAPKSYRSANEAFRHISASLSEARDNQVMLQTVTMLEAANVSAPLQGLKRAVLALHGAAPGQLETAIPAAVVSLREAAVAFRALRLKPGGFSTLQAGLERSYREGRRGIKRAYADNAPDEAFHELRKAVQQHWRQMQLLERAWPGYCTARAAAARELSEILGNDQDLSVLKAFIRRAEGLRPLEAKACRAAIVARQKELRAAARPRLERLFAERPGDLGRHMRHLWASARAIGDGEPAAERPETKPVPDRGRDKGRIIAA